MISCDQDVMKLYEHHITFIIFRAPGYTKSVCAGPTRKVRMKK